MPSSNALQESRIVRETLTLKMCPLRLLHNELHLTCMNITFVQVQVKSWTLLQLSLPPAAEYSEGCKMLDHGFNALFEVPRQ